MGWPKGVSYEQKLGTTYASFLCAQKKLYYQQQTNFSFQGWRQSAASKQKISIGMKKARANKFWNNKRTKQNDESSE